MLKKLVMINRITFFNELFMIKRIAKLIIKSFT